MTGMRFLMFLVAASINGAVEWGFMYRTSMVRCNLPVVDVISFRPLFIRITKGKYSATMERRSGLYFLFSNIKKSCNNINKSFNNINKSFININKYDEHLLILMNDFLKLENQFLILENHFLIL